MDDALRAVDLTTAVLIVAVIVFGIVLPGLAWAVGAFDRSGKGRHAADTPKSPPWLNDIYQDAMAWLARNEKAQRELADARWGGEER